MESIAWTILPKRRSFLCQPTAMKKSTTAEDVRLSWPPKAGRSKRSTTFKTSAWKWVRRTICPIFPSTKTSQFINKSRRYWNCATMLSRSINQILKTLAVWKRAIRTRSIWPRVSTTDLWKSSRKWKQTTLLIWWQSGTSILRLLTYKMTILEKTSLKSTWSRTISKIISKRFLKESGNREITLNAEKV